jgi:hypothetical protein
MTGREPMNPHTGQYALAGSISAWDALLQPTNGQRRALRRAYRGRTLRVYGRYGSRQWLAPWPGTRLVVKDPFAVLAITAAHETTGALPVLVYRHPGAVLASYRRMGWSPDITELERALPSDQRSSAPTSDPAAQLAWFWSTINNRALLSIQNIAQAVVVDHEQLAHGGPAAMRQVYAACGLTWPERQPATVAPAATQPDSTAAVASSAAPVAAVNDGGHQLHRLDRPSDQVASAWRAKVNPADMATVEGIAGATLDALRSRSLRLDAGPEPS